MMKSSKRRVEQTWEHLLTQRLVLRKLKQFFKRAFEEISKILKNISTLNGL